MPTDLELVNSIMMDGLKPKYEKAWKRLRVKLDAQQEKVKTCPHCGSHKVTVFDSDNDICGNCNRWFDGT